MAALAATVVVGALAPVGLVLASGALVNGARQALDGRSFASASLLVPLGAVVVLMLLAQLSAPTREFAAERCGRRLDGELRLRVISASVEPATIAHLEDPDILDELSAAEAVATAKVSPGESMLAAANIATVRLQGICLALLLVPLEWWLAPLLLVGTWLVRWLLLQDYRKAVELFQHSERVLRRSSYFRELALDRKGAKEVRAFGLAEFVESRHHDAWSTGIQELRRRRAENRWRMPVGTALLVGVAALAYVVLADAAAGGRVGVAAAVVYAQAVAGSVVVFLGPDYLRVWEGLAAASATRRFERSTAAIASTVTGVASSVGLPRESIVFDRVTFRYPRSDRDVLRDLTLEVRAGHSLALVGDNGAGKTTLLKLLARFYEPTAGAITVDGAPLETFDPRDWQRRVAAVFQDFERYPLSARENVALADDVVDEAVLEQAAGRAKADVVVASLSNGWSTVLAPDLGGEDLSGGQWQRLALARALYAGARGARILVLDEPTAQLDARAEAEFYDAFLELTAGLTTIVVSHRFSTVRLADSIAVIEHGSVVEQGSHEQLLARGGRYASSFAMQASYLVDPVPASHAPDA